MIRSISIEPDVTVSWWGKRGFTILDVFVDDEMNSALLPMPTIFSDDSVSRTLSETFPDSFYSCIAATSALLDSMNLTISWILSLTSLQFSLRRRLSFHPEDIRVQVEQRSSISSIHRFIIATVFSSMESSIPARLLRILLQRAGIELNPGPLWYCSVCKQRLRRNLITVLCKVQQLVTPTEMFRPRES